MRDCTNTIDVIININVINSDFLHYSNFFVYIYTYVIIYVLFVYRLFVGYL